jgi:hypothetical protein
MVEKMNAKGKHHTADAFFSFMYSETLVEAKTTLI